MSIPILVETDRLVLREMSIDDVTDRYCSWLHDEEVTRYLEARFDDNSPESIRAYVGSRIADESTVFAAIIEKPDRFIGTIKVGPVDPDHGRADVGIMLGEPSAWGRGYATEAIQAMSRFAFDQLGLSRLSAGAYAVNLGSIKAFTRAGFQLEGRLRNGAQVNAGRVDVVLMGLLASELGQRTDRLAGEMSAPEALTLSINAERTVQRDTFLGGEGDEWFQRNPIGDVTPDRRDELVASRVSTSSSVLEIGCADGRRLAAVRSLAPARKFVGIDPSITAIEAGRGRFPDLDLMLGSADNLPLNEEFDLVVVGFCLYLCDRALLPRIVSEIDRVLRDGGTLVIIDFDPPTATRRRYCHRPGLWSYKLDYATLFTALPSYSLIHKESYLEGGEEPLVPDPSRIAMNVLVKRLPGAYVEEPDE